MDEARGNRQLILSLSAELFSLRGYDAVSVTEIVEAAGVTKPTLYHYFGSKRGLLDSLIAERGAPFLLAAGAGTGLESDVPLGLERIAFAFIQASRADPVFARLRLGMRFGPPSSEASVAAEDFNSTIRRRIESWFMEAEKHHGNMRGRSAMYAVSFLATLDAYVAFELRGDPALDDPNVRAILRQFMYGIFS